MALKIDPSCLLNGELSQKIMRRLEMRNQQCELEMQCELEKLEMLLMMLKQLFWRETESER